MNVAGVKAYPYPINPSWERVLPVGIHRSIPLDIDPFCRECWPAIKSQPEGAEG